MSNTKTAIVVSFVVGAILAFFVAYLLLRPSLPSVQALRCDVPPNEFLKVSGFEVKILDADVKSLKPRKGDSPQPRMARLQWRCDVQNISTIAVRYGLKTELLDKDAFVLATTTVDSQYDQGDLSPGQTQTVHHDEILEYSRVRSLAACRIAPQALKTETQMQQERQRQLTQQTEANERQRVAQEQEFERKRKAREQEWEQKRAADELKREQDAHESEERARVVKAEQQKRIDVAKEKWKGIKEGMSKTDVETLLGKPEAIQAYSMIGDVWKYPRVEGTYKNPTVSFTPAGKVKGWEMP